MAVLELPVFQRGSAEIDEFISVYCPREDCPSQRGEEQVAFFVHKATWRKTRRQRSVAPIRGRRQFVVIVGRVCPYCHKVSKLPPGR